MIQTIETTGKTEEDAIQKALTQLGMERDDVSVEIITMAKPGFLGIGATQACVRVSYDDGKAEAPKEKEDKPRVFQAEVLQKKEKRQNKREEKKAEEKQEEEFVPVDYGEESTDEKAQAVRTFLKGLLTHMDSAAEVKVYETEKNRYTAILEGERLGGLIGRRGETLDAMQQLTNYSVNRGSEHSRVRVQIDAENYRAKREQSLKRLAEKVAGKAVRERRNVTLEPMNAYERHVIHTALQDVEHITTFSIGTEPNRRVVVSFEQ